MSGGLSGGGFGGGLSPRAEDVAAAARSSRQRRVGRGVIKALQLEFESGTEERSKKSSRTAVATGPRNHTPAHLAS